PFPYTTLFRSRVRSVAEWPGTPEGLAAPQCDPASRARDGGPDNARLPRRARAPDWRAQGRLDFSLRPDSPDPPGGLGRLHGRLELREGQPDFGPGAPDQRP